MPGANSGAPVRHEWTEEAAFVISGQLVYELEERKKRVEVGPNDSIFIRANEEHFVKNEGNEPALRISIYLKKENN